MKYISYILRIIRGIYRYLLSIFIYIRVQMLLLLNQVQHGKINCRGVPFIAIVPGGVCNIGDNFTMNNGMRYNPIGYPQPCMMVVTQGAKLIIGKNVGISQTSLICHHSITIGDNVKIGGGVKIYDTDFHSLDPDIRKNKELDIQSKKVAPVIIGNNVFIGAGSIVLKGVTIGDNSIVGAGSVVSRDIPSNEIWGGNPVKFIKKIKQ